MNFKSISSIPFRNILRVNDPDKVFIKQLIGNNTNHVNVLEQILTLLGSEMPLVKNADGLISAKATLAKATSLIKEGGILYKDGLTLEVHDFAGMLKYLTISPRGTILGSFSQTKYPRYAANVPLVLSTFKVYRNVKYSDWDWKDPAISFLVDPDILSMSEHFNKPYQVSKEELLEFREINLDGISDPKSAWRTKATGNDYFDSLNRLQRTIMMQTWVSDSEIVHDLAITNLENIDEKAKPLVNSSIEIKGTNPWLDLFGMPTDKQAKSIASKLKVDELPWDA